MCKTNLYKNTDDDINYFKMTIHNIFCLLGHGVFAKTNFEKGDFLLEYKGKSEIVYVL